jgi:FtsP/CotA-like multicopper oxidase with cupredoxin domain
VDTLGTVRVREESADESHADAFRTLRSHPDVERGIERYREAFDGPVDHRLHLTMEASGLPFPVSPLVRKDSTYFHPVEAAGTMPRMNWVTTTRQVRWILRDIETGNENMDIDWTFEENDVAKIRITNSSKSVHPMNHPIHLHGQRFLVVERDGERTGNLAWKDTVTIPVGSTVDLLVHFSNPGDWLMHCHIAEHVESGMETVISVLPGDR